VTDLQSLLGHSSLATTQVYAKMVDSRTRASVQALDYGLPKAPEAKNPDGVRTTCVPVEGEGGEGEVAEGEADPPLPLPGPEDTSGGRSWIRTRDPLRVGEALYR
jgi:hypothetical protein